MLVLCTYAMTPHDSRVVVCVRYFTDVMRDSRNVKKAYIGAVVFMDGALQNS